MEDCAICLRQKEEKNGRASVIASNNMWRLRHSGETNVIGYVVLESDRHFLDLSESTDAEAASLGPILKGVMQSMRELLSCERIYTFTLAEKVPHFHVHVIPATKSMPKGFRGRGIMSYPLTPGPNPSLSANFSQSMAKRLKSVFI